MDSRKPYLRGVGFLILAALALPVWTSDAQAAGGPKKKWMSAGRPAFSPERSPEQRRSLFEAWKKQHRSAPGSTETRRTEVPGGAVASMVGRASMVINSAGTVVYTKNFIGTNCDPNVESSLNWGPNTA